MSAFAAELAELEALAGGGDGDDGATTAADPFQGLAGVPGANEPEPALAVGRVAIASAPKLLGAAAAASTSSAAPHSSAAAAAAPVGTATASAKDQKSATPAAAPVVAAAPKLQVISAGPQLNLQPDILPTGHGVRAHRTEDQEIADGITAMDAAAKARHQIKQSFTNANASGGGGGDDDGGDGGGGGGGGPMRTDKKKKHLRVAAGKVWEDNTLADWPDNDFRIFCGDLGNEVNDQTLAKVFSKYASFNKARVIREKHSQKSKGFGFVSFLDPFDCAAALREMNGKYVGNRPIKLRKSTHADRDLKTQQKANRGGKGNKR